MHYSTSPSTMPQEQKWTVSPEFGDALMTAMRERTESGGLIPRLPSLLQLPVSVNAASGPARIPETSTDNAKLTMKTRVAVRDKTPHRFQVVPLREVVSLAPPAQDATPLSKASRSRGAPYTTKLNFHGDNKSRVLGANENLVSAITRLQGLVPAATFERHERARTLSERNGNLPDSEQPCLAIQPSNPVVSSTPSEEHPIPACRTALPPASDRLQAHPITTHRSSMPVRSILRTRNANEHERSHFKSPSLGNLHQKPPLSQQHDYATLPRVGCRKRTNTLSVDDSVCLKDDLAMYEETKNLERRRPLEHNALKRHAIYTQSLYVPHDERESLPGRILLTTGSKRLPFLDTEGDGTSDLNPRRRRASRSSLQSNTSALHSTQQAMTLSRNYSALELADIQHIPRPTFPSSFAQDFSSDSQSSISSIYSQDGASLNSQNSQATLTQTRPLAQSRLSSEYQLIVRRQTREYGKEVIAHHPIIVALLAAVDEALKEWRYTTSS